MTKRIRVRVKKRPLRIDIATLFPDMCETVLNESIVGRARRAGKIELCCHQIRDYSTDKHRRVDDTPYGGGMGMVMQAEPIYRCFKEVTKDFPRKPHVIYMSPKGTVLTQQKAVDQRVIDKIADEEISIGDYVLTGGELPALVLTDAVARMCGGVLSAEECFTEESHFSGLLEYPHYTRPEVWEGEKVPGVLLTGHHKNIAEFRHSEAVKITKERRPDLYKKFTENINMNGE